MDDHVHGIGTRGRIWWRKVDYMLWSQGLERLVLSCLAMLGEVGYHLSWGTYLEGNFILLHIQLKSLRRDPLSLTYALVMWVTIPWVLDILYKSTKLKSTCYEDTTISSRYSISVQFHTSVRAERASETKASNSPHIMQHTTCKTQNTKEEEI
jgi:hypothetical protein